MAAYWAGLIRLMLFSCIYIYTSIGGGFATPRIRNVEHGGLVTISGRSPRLPLCILIWCCCVSAAVYLLLCIHRCVSATVYPPLCLLCCISTTVSAAVHLPLCIRCCVSAAVYLPLWIRPCVSAPVNMYFDPVLYIWHCIHRRVSATVYISATAYPPLYICHCVCCVVESDWVQREIEFCLLNILMVESMPLHG